MAQVKLKEEQELRERAEEEQELRERAEEQHSLVLEFKEEPESREIQSLEDTGPVVHCVKEEPEEVEIKAEPQFLHVSVKSEEGESQSSLLHHTEENREDTGSSDTDDSEDWAPSAQRRSTKAEERSDSESSWEFNPPPSKTQRAKRQMEDLTASVCGKKYWTFPKKRPFKCPVCGKCFITRTHQKRHVSSHAGEYSYKCSVCGEVFRQSGHLRMHMKRHAPGVHCSVCGTRFPTMSRLKLHVNTHTRDTPHGCPVCDLSFIHLSSLHRHMRTHADERPFTCRVCAQQFAEIGKLKSHMKVHSEQSDVT